jgi:hypothetical protein
MIALLISGALAVDQAETTASATHARVHYVPRSAESIFAIPLAGNVEVLMRKLTGMIVALGVVVSAAVAAQKPAEQTWTGKISDSKCKEKHMAAEHDGKKMTDADCTTVCVKGGAKYVFVSDGKVYQLANQSSKTLASHAGQEVQLTGEMKGDTITATKVAAVVKPAK